METSCTIGKQRNTMCVYQVRQHNTTHSMKQQDDFRIEGFMWFDTVRKTSILNVSANSSQPAYSTRFFMILFVRFNIEKVDWSLRVWPIGAAVNISFSADKYIYWHEQSLSIKPHRDAISLKGGGDCHRNAPPPWWTGGGGGDGDSRQSRYDGVSEYK